MKHGFFFKLFALALFSTCNVLGKGMVQVRLGAGSTALQTKESFPAEPLVFTGDSLYSTAQNYPVNLPVNLGIGGNIGWLTDTKIRFGASVGGCLLPQQGGTVTYTSASDGTLNITYGKILLEKQNLSANNSVSVCADGCFTQGAEFILASNTPSLTTNSVVTGIAYTPETVTTTKLNGLSGNQSIVLVSNGTGGDTCVMKDPGGTVQFAYGRKVAVDTASNNIIKSNKDDAMVGADHFTVNNFNTTAPIHTLATDRINGIDSSKEIDVIKTMNPPSMTSSNATGIAYDGLNANAHPLTHTSSAVSPLTDVTLVDDPDGAMLKGITLVDVNDPQPGTQVVTGVTATSGTNLGSVSYRSKGYLQALAHLETSLGKWTFGAQLGYARHLVDVQLEETAGGILTSNALPSQTVHAFVGGPSLSYAITHAVTCGVYTNVHLGDFTVDLPSGNALRNGFQFLEGGVYLRLSTGG